MKLLRWALVAAVTLFSTFGLQAKTTFNLGIMGGSSHTNYRLVKYHDAIDNNTGFNVGVGATLKISLISLSPELIYTNTQFEIDDPEVLGGSCNIRDQRLDVPVVVGLNFLKIVRIEAGPQFSIYDKAKATYYDNSNIGNEDLGRITPDMGYILGLRLTIFKRLMVGARYYGHIEGYKFADSGYNIRSHSYTLSAGFKF